jgi:hypothetical protein
LPAKGRAGSTLRLQLLLDLREFLLGPLDLQPFQLAVRKRAREAAADLAERGETASH